MIVHTYLYPVSVKDTNIIPISIRFTIYNNGKQIFDTKICYLHYFINNQNYTIDYLQESLYDILLLTSISMEEANLFTSKFEDYILNIVKNNLYKNSVGPWFIHLITK